MLLIANSVDVSSVPEEIRILPLGTVESRKGTFEVNEESVRRIIDGFRERRLDLVIDYEHQTLENVQAPAAGWIKDIYKAENALVAKVEWTERAKQYLANKEYRYLSPVVMVNKSNKQAIELHSVALTNTPAIDGMFPIVNSIGADASPSSESKDILKMIKELLGLDAGTDAEDITEKIKELLQAKTATENELNGLKYEAFEKQVDDVIQYALKAGKLSNSMVNGARKMAEKDIEAFKDYIQTAPQVVPIGRFALEKTDNTKSGGSHIDNLLGISEEDIRKYRH
ncbi:hypothetical protein BEI59_17355 [Eisenbergiella tayi]|jgi:phage I-like protein|uniref:Mu-like prophage I protein n=1 Tax=Eisenbergiella tayi TaxID=1432052 RepID=A0A1E3UG29_9FIRM|nr:phage protease [Eisenbergiella tayi]ODR49703.1 hypothetical protein BEI59_17355 [Eisenbergiella tayi]